MVVTTRDADAALRRVVALRDRVTREAFYQQCDRLLDMRNRAALVAKLEAEHAGLALVGENGPELVDLPPRTGAR